jgi:hypothetical protein
VSLLIDAIPPIKNMEKFVVGMSIAEVARSYNLDERCIIKLDSNENCLGMGDTFIRITVGTPDQNTRLVKVLNEIYRNL